MDRIEWGELTDGALGLRISQAGYDVKSNPIDNERLIFSTEWTETVRAIIGSGSFSVGSGTTSTVNYPSALGFYPIITIGQQVGSDINFGGVYAPGTFKYSLNGVTTDYKKGVWLYYGQSSFTVENYTGSTLTGYYFLTRFGF